MPRPIDQEALSAALKKLREVRDGANADVEYKRRLTGPEAGAVLSHLWDAVDEAAKANRNRDAAQDALVACREAIPHLRDACRAIAKATKSAGARRAR